MIEIPITYKSESNLMSYPQTAGGSDAPFMLFIRHKPVYDSQALNLQQSPTVIKTISNIALYVPLNFGLNDSMTYDTAETGVIGNIVNAAASEGRNLGDLMPDDFSLDNPDVAATLTQYGPAVSATVGGLLGGKNGLLSGGGVLAGATLAAQEAKKATQATLNPRQFALFKQPNMRTFSFFFIFVPNNKNESDSVLKIIKEFRTAMYPELSDQGLSYTFPDAFTISFENTEGYPKLPEVACTNATVTYNPNTQSFFTHKNRPVEIHLNLTFQELQPMHRGMVERGY